VSEISLTQNICRIIGAQGVQRFAVSLRTRAGRSGCRRPKWLEQKVFQAARPMTGNNDELSKRVVEGRIVASGHVSRWQPVCPQGALRCVYLAVRSTVIGGGPRWDSLPEFQHSSQWDMRAQGDSVFAHCVWEPCNASFRHGQNGWGRSLIRRKAAIYSKSGLRFRHRRGDCAVCRAVTGRCRLYPARRAIAPRLIQNGYIQDANVTR